MKKIIGSLVIAGLIISLTACSLNGTNKEKDTSIRANYISPADLTKREETILSTVASSGGSFVFDFRNTKFKEASVWMEKYKSGKLIGDQTGEMRTEIGKKGFVVLAFPNVLDSDRTFYIGIGDQNGSSSASIIDEKPKAPTMSLTSGTFTEKKKISDGEIVLATLSFSNNEKGISSISPDFYEKPADHMDLLKNYDFVYIFKIEFKK